MVITLSLSLSTGHAARTVDSHLTPQDLQRFQSVFVSALTSNDLQSIYYASLNIEPTSADEKKQLCQKLNKLHEESKLNVSFFFPVFVGKYIMFLLIFFRNLKKTFI